MSFRHPINKPNINNPFGADASYYAKFGYKGHNGVDYAHPTGTPVYAADAGTVAFEGWGQHHSWMGVPAGICALIKHSKNYTGYAHLSRTIVNNGQKVKKGQLIGYVGATGAATGPHLHFEVLPLSPNFSNGYAGRINPAPLMDKPRKTATAAEVRKAYLDILERTVDANGLRHYTTNGMTIAQVRADLEKSAEKKRLEARKAAAKKAEAERKAAEAKKAAERKKAEEAARKAQEEADRLAREQEAAEQEAEAKASELDRLVKENNDLLKKIWKLLNSLWGSLTNLHKKVKGDK